MNKRVKLTFKLHNTEVKYKKKKMFNDFSHLNVSHLATNKLTSNGFEVSFLVLLNLNSSCDRTQETSRRIFWHRASQSQISSLILFKMFSKQNFYAVLSHKQAMKNGIWHVLGSLLHYS